MVARDILDEAARRITEAVRATLTAARPQGGTAVRSIKKEIVYLVRNFDEAKEDAAVVAYVTKRAGGSGYTIDFFRRMRAARAPHQGKKRKTWIQAVRIGDIAVVGVPGEFFTTLEVDIKHRSPFCRTLIAGVANDYIGYIPDAEAYDLGGYQVSTGFHSLVARGTGEVIVAEALRLLEELNRN